MKTKIMKRDQDGGAVVEFAIILPLLIVLLFGSVEFGLLLYNKHIITNACREGARAGIVSRTPRLSDLEIEAVVNKYADKYLVTFGSKNFPAPIINRGGDDFGDDLSVTITYEYNFLVLKSFGFGPITLQAKTIMKMD